MDMVVSALIGIGAVVGWCALAAAGALLGGRMIHERDAHDRPVRTASPAPATH